MRFGAIFGTPMIRIHAAPPRRREARTGCGKQSAARVAAQEIDMTNVFVLGLGAVLFAAAFACTKICDRL